MSKGRNSWITREELGYGFFPGGDPRKFHPDSECCTPEEIAAHKAACEAWDRGEQNAEPSQGCQHLAEGVIACGGRFGTGSYEYEVTEPPDTRYWRRRLTSSLRMFSKRFDRQERQRDRFKNTRNAWRKEARRRIAELKAKRQAAAA